MIFSWFNRAPRMPHTNVQKPVRSWAKPRLEALEEWKHCRVKMGLPKFEFMNTHGLRQELSALGMPLVFSPKADFSGISSEANLRLDNVVHKAYVKVNEEGTEAAAATAVLLAEPISRGPTELPPLVSFHADRPFVYIIRESSTGTVLFVGRVADPRPR